VVRLLLRRLAVSVPLLLVVCSTTFFLAALIPGDLARTILGPNASQAQYLQLRQELDLNKPLTERYWAWLTAAVHGNLGHSLFNQESVTALLDTRLPTTLSLVIGATVVAALLGVALGIASARSTGVLARIVDALALVGLAVPNFFLGLLLVSWFAVSLQLLPATGYVPFTQSPAELGEEPRAAGRHAGAPRSGGNREADTRRDEGRLDSAVRPYAAGFRHLAAFDYVQARLAKRGDSRGDSHRARIHWRTERDGAG
jgi:ABC-type dipeptide/oligopeptide/nickel transport systems, permease components